MLASLRESYVWNLLERTSGRTQSCRAKTQGQRQSDQDQQVKREDSEKPAAERLLAGLMAQDLLRDECAEAAADEREAKKRGFGDAAPAGSRLGLVERDGREGEKIDRCEIKSDRGTERR